MSKLEKINIIMESKNIREYINMMFNERNLAKNNIKNLIILINSKTNISRNIIYKKQKILLI